MMPDCKPRFKHAGYTKQLVLHSVAKSKLKLISVVGRGITHAFFAATGNAALQISKKLKVSLNLTLAHLNRFLNMSKPLKIEFFSKNEVSSIVESCKKIPIFSNM